MQEVEHLLLEGPPTPQLAGFKLFNRKIWQIGEVISINHHTVWVRIPKVLSPKGRLLRVSRPIKRHIKKDAVLLGSE